jgi:hypothetical protein
VVITVLNEDTVDASITEDGLKAVNNTRRVTRRMWNRPGEICNCISIEIDAAILETNSAFELDVSKSKIERIFQAIYSRSPTIRFRVFRFDRWTNIKGVGGFDPSEMCHGLIFTTVLAIIEKVGPSVCGGDPQSNAGDAFE